MNLFIWLGAKAKGFVGLRSTNPILNVQIVHSADYTISRNKNKIALPAISQQVADEDLKEGKFVHIERESMRLLVRCSQT
jgi:hypothetical protein